MKKRFQIMLKTRWKLPVFIASCLCIILLLTVLPYNLWLQSGIEYIGITSIRGDSMEPNIKNNDIMFIQPTKFERGEIVVAKCPYTEKYAASTNLALLKRIVGLPGETVEIVEDGILIDGELLKEEWTNNANLSLRDGNNIQEIVLSDNEYFLLGDNRDNSFDSRHVGAIHKSRFLYGLTTEPNDYTNRIMTLAISVAVTNIMLIVALSGLLMVVLTMEPKSNRLAVNRHIIQSSNKPIYKKATSKGNVIKTKTSRTSVVSTYESAHNAKNHLHKSNKKKKKK